MLGGEVLDSLSIGTGPEVGHGCGWEDGRMEFSILSLQRVNLEVELSGEGVGSFLRGLHPVTGILVLGARPPNAAGIATKHPL